MTYNDSIEKIRENIKVGSSPRRYICEVHREIYDVIDEHVPDDKRETALNLVAEAYWYGKRMSDRLKELNSDLRDETPVNPDFHDDLERRAKRVGLLRRIASINIETIDWCNRKCDWCPNKNRETSPDNLMDKDVWCRIIRQLVDYAYKGEIHPFLNGEPTMDKRLPALVQYAKSILPECVFKLITNGDGLKAPIDVQIFLSAGIDKIHMNHYTGKLSGIGKARDNLFPQMTHIGMKELMPSFYNRAGKVDYTPAKKFLKCEYFLNKLAFNYKGDMVLCCSDFNSEVVFGNIMDQSLAAIINGELYQKYYKAHKNGGAKQLPLCKECNRI